MRSVGIPGTDYKFSVSGGFELRTGQHRVEQAENRLRQAQETQQRLLDARNSQEGSQDPQASDTAAGGHVETPNAAMSEPQPTVLPDAGDAYPQPDIMLPHRGADGRIIALSNPDLNRLPAVMEGYPLLLTMPGPAVYSAGNYVQLSVARFVGDDEIRGGLHVPANVAQGLHEVTIGELRQQSAALQVAYEGNDWQLGNPPDDFKPGKLGPLVWDNVLVGHYGWIARDQDKIIEVPENWSRWFCLDEGNTLELISFDPQTIGNMRDEDLRTVLNYLDLPGRRGAVRWQTDKDNFESRPVKQLSRSATLALMAEIRLATHDGFVRIAGNHPIPVIPELLQFGPLNLFGKEKTPGILQIIASRVPAAESERRHLELVAGAKMVRNMLDTFFAYPVLTTATDLQQLVDVAGSEVAIPQRLTPEQLRGALYAGYALGMVLGGVWDYADAVKSWDKFRQESIKLFLKTTAGLGLAVPSLIATSGSAILLLPGFAELCNAAVDKLVEKLYKARDWDRDLTANIADIEATLTLTAHESKDQRQIEYVGNLIKGLRQCLVQIQGRRNEYRDWVRQNLPRQFPFGLGYR